MAIGFKNQQEQPCVMKELPQRIERKFYIPPHKLDMAYSLLRHICRQHGAYPSEQINSLYYDTADLEQYEKSLEGELRKDKVRIRWYGKLEEFKGAQMGFIELKSREGFASTKQRMELRVMPGRMVEERLSQGIVSRRLLEETLAGFGYFPSNPLFPVIRISYWRYRFSDLLSGQTLAMDCRIRSQMIALGYKSGTAEVELPGGVLEIKGKSVELPVTLIKMKALDIDWSRFSKYSACIEAHTDSPGTVGWLSPSGKLIN